MNYYPHHIGDFNNATRHLSRIERSVYRDLIDLYYDTESPLINDLSLICRRVLAQDEQELTAVEQVLSEYFILTDNGYENHRCNEIIKEFQRNKKNKAKAGKASAKARKALKDKEINNVTGVKQVLSRCSEPITITNNQEPAKKPTSKNKFSDDDMKAAVWILELIRSRLPKFKLPNLDSWANTIRLMRQIDEREHIEIAKVFKWAANDNFWQSNILSPTKLRDKFDQLTSNMKSKGNSYGNGQNRKPTQCEQLEENERVANEWLESQGIAPEADGENLERVINPI